MLFAQSVHYPNTQFSRYQGIGLTSQRRRDKLVAMLVEQLRLTDQQLIEVLRVTPRHLFVDEALASRAYENTALPIGFGQTISQPTIVATMTNLLLGCDRPLQRVLEIGTGSGYQTALLSQLVQQVWTVERIPELLQQAESRLSALGLKNIRYHVAGTQLGWPAAGPFDAILSAAAPEKVPESLLDQLAVGGRLVMPVGAQGHQQHLMVIERTASGFKERLVGDVLFVPLITAEAA